MSALCEGLVVVVTGGGRGIGRGHALEFAKAGAKVVVNDLGASTDGSGSSTGPAAEVVEQIRAAGGEAVVNGDDIADFDGARRLIETAVDAFGDLNVVVNNAGILRDRMLVNMTPEEWDVVVRVHLRGAYAITHHAANYWRDRSKAGDNVHGRLIHTTSGSGIYGNVGQANYGAAKAGVASLAIIAAMELSRYGVTVNALAPAAMTRLTAGAQDLLSKPAEQGFDENAPENIAPLAVWLASAEAAEVTGRVFNVRGGFVSVAEGWVSGPSEDKGARWEPTELGAVIPGLLARSRPNSDMMGEPFATETQVV